MWLPFELRRLDEAMKPQVLRFIDSWSDDDAYDRFGSAGIGGQQWLVNQLTQHNRHALIALNCGMVIGLLDHIEADAAIHIGIVVDQRYRKLSIGSTLVRAMLRSRQFTFPVIAECSNRNYAAVNLLRSCQFNPIAIDRYEMTWRYQ